MNNADIDSRIGQNDIEKLLEIGLNAFEVDLHEDAKRSFLKGLSYNPSDVSMLSAFTICFGVSNFAKRLLEISKSITQQEKDILARISFVRPEIIRDVYNTYLYFSNFERLEYLEENYYDVLHNYIFVIFKTLKKSDLNKRIYLTRRFPKIITNDILFDEYLFLDDKEYVGSLISLGVSVVDIFKRFFQKNKPISCYKGNVVFKTKALPLTTLDLYLQFGLNIEEIRFKIKEEYTQWDEGYCSTVITLEEEMNLYTFLKKFEQGKFFHTIKRNGYSYNGSVEYSFDKYGCEDVSYVDYINLLKKYGCG